MSKRLALLALCVLAPSVASAVEMGLGASARSDEATVYLPINLNPGLRIEPFFSFGESESTTGGTTTETESRQLGAGAFVRMQLAERLQPYFGGRVSYLESETTTTAGFVSVTSDLDGFRLEPAIGIEFFVTERVGVSLEAFLYREELDGSAGGAPVDDESMGNGTRVLLRIMP